MKIKSMLVGLSSLALFSSAQAAVRYVGNTADGDVTTVIDLASTNPTLLGYGGSYTAASGTDAAQWNWSSTDTFVLEEIIVITNGTLVIDAGSVVRGQPKAAATFNPGALIIAAGAKLIADGGNSSSPIIFTTASTTGLPTDGRASGANPVFWDITPKTVPQSSNTAALWGGLVLLGKAPTNVDRDAGIVSPAGGNAFGNTNGGTAAQIIYGYGYGANKNTFDGVYTSGGAFTGQITTPETDDRSSIEGVPAASLAHTSGADRFGGFEAADNSGVVRFVSIRHGGAELATANELNGLTLGGVGRGTTIEFVEIYGNTDDGVEIFGGNVNLNHIVIVDADDDGLDIDVGYSGTVQFLLVVGGTQSDKLCEWDGSYEAEAVNGFTVAGPVVSSKGPVANFNVYNATLIGNTGGVAQGLNIRDQSAPRLVNSIIANPVANAIEIDNRAGVSDSNDTLQNFKSGFAEFRGVTGFKSSLTGVANWVAGVSNAGANATEAEVEAELNATKRANYFDAASFNPGLQNLPTVALSNTSQIKMVPDSSLVTGGAVDSVLEDPVATYNASIVPVFYRGAFEADVSAWTNGWTASAVKGVLFTN